MAKWEYEVAKYNRPPREGKTQEDWIMNGEGYNLKELLNNMGEKGYELDRQVEENYRGESYKVTDFYLIFKKKLN